MDVDSLTVWSLTNPPERHGRKARTLVLVKFVVKEKDCTSFVIIVCRFIQHFNIIDVLFLFQILAVMPPKEPKEKRGKSYKTRTIAVPSEFSINLQHRVTNLEEQLNVLQAKAADDVRSLHKEIHEIKEQIRHLSTITGESSGWGDVLLEGNLSRPVVTVEETDDD